MLEKVNICKNDNLDCYYLAQFLATNNCNFVKELVRRLMPLLKKRIVLWFRNGRRALSTTCSGVPRQQMMMTLTSRRQNGCP